MEPDSSPGTSEAPSALTTVECRARDSTLESIRIGGYAIRGVIADVTVICADDVATRRLERVVDGSLAFHSLRPAPATALVAFIGAPPLSLSRSRREKAPREKAPFPFLVSLRSRNGGFCVMGFSLSLCSVCFPLFWQWEWGFKRSVPCAEDRGCEHSPPTPWYCVYSAQTIQILAKNDLLLRIILGSVCEIAERKECIF